jgi:hypothetical protein
MANKTTNKITLPKKLFDSLIEAQESWERVSNELEDFLISLDKRFIRKMKKARKENLRGKTRDLIKLKKFQSAKWSF